MSKNYWVKDFSWCLLGFGLLMEPLGALAQQGVATGRAIVYQVPARGEAARFQVPQVRLANTAAARRINRLLMRVTLNDWDGVDSTASPQRQLYQAARACCYDPETRQWAAAGSGLTGSEYAVLLNQAELLSLSLTKQYTGAHHVYGTEFFTFDLRTGRRLVLRDVVTDPPEQLTRRLRGAARRRFQDIMEQATAALRSGQADSAGVAYAAERLGWNYATQRINFADDAPLPAGTEQPIVDLPSPGLYGETNFALTPKTLLLFYSPEFHRLRQDYAPADTYRFAYRTLHVQPLLAWPQPPTPKKLATKHAN